MEAVIFLGVVIFLQCQFAVYLVYAYMLPRTRTTTTTIQGQLPGGG